LPVVAVNQNGAAEMIANGYDGFLTDLNPQFFANKVMELINNHTMRRKMGQCAKKNAESISSLNCALRLLDCYMDLMESKSIAKGQ